jgi:hypothetical protein
MPLDLMLPEDKRLRPKTLHVLFDAALRHVAELEPPRKQEQDQDGSPDGRRRDVGRSVL